MPLAIVLASNNSGKLAEFSRLLAPWNVRVLPQGDFVSTAAEEIGSTFEANAVLKARHAATAAELPAIADDSGLEVDILGGAPGVYSARYAGPNATDAENNRKLLDALRSVPPQLRTARFRCVLAYVADARAEPIIASGVWHGRILLQPRGERGFGYDPVFLPNDSRLSAGELESVQKNQLSHRGQALRDLTAQLRAHGIIAPRNE
jgi:XTP/dITP diphosphohydrolase